MNINCSELRKDIDKTREAYDHLHEKTEEATESGKGKAKVMSISLLPNGNMLVGGGGGALYETQIPPRSLDTLKQSLDKIIGQS